MSCIPSRRTGSREFLSAALLLSTIACGGEGGGSAAPAAEPARRPNILLISLDSVRADMLSCYGFVPPFAKGKATTPHLDQIAAEGARFERAYSSSTWTLASHMALITGQPDVVHGVEVDNRSLSAERPVLAELLQDGGYQTAGFYSGPYLDPRYGFGRGFRRYESAYGGPLAEAAEEERRAFAAVDAAKAQGRDLEAVIEDLDRAIRKLEDLSHLDVSSERVTDGAISALDEAGEGQPWFLFAHYFDPHYDYVAPADFATSFDPGYGGELDGRGLLVDPRISVSEPRPRDPFRRRLVASPRDWQHLLSLYAAELAWTDSQIGRLLGAIEERGELDNTLIVVVADHGDEFFEHGHLGHRMNLFNESLQVPMILRFPANIAGGTVVPGPVATYDAFATILSAAGIEAPPGTTARDLQPAIDGVSAQEHRPLSRLIRVHYGPGPEGTRLRTTRVFESFLAWPIKVLRLREWSDRPKGTISQGAAQEIEKRAQLGREVDFSLRWIDLGADPRESAASWSTDFEEPRAKRALAEFQALYPRLLRLRRRPNLVPQDRGQQAQLQALGYGGEDEDQPSTDEQLEYYTLSPPGR